LPRAPEGNDLWKFVKFVHDLLEVWVNRVAQQQKEFRDFNEVDRTVIALGWKDFDQLWKVHQHSLRTALQSVQSDKLRLHGLNGDAMTMKVHSVRKRHTTVRRLLGALATLPDRSWRWVRKSWSNLFEAIDVPLGSIEKVLEGVPIAGGIVGGLKEFKECVEVDSKILEE
jgi:hypothetical protein